MILDITFHDKAPVQHQGVRLTTVYTTHDADAKPEIIVHFYDPREHSVAYPMVEVKTCTVTND